MTRTLQGLRKVKFLSARTLSARSYWHLMGKLRPVAAVTSDCRSIEESLESGRKVVDLLDRLGVLGPEMVTLQIGSGLGRVEHHLRSKVRKCWGVDISRSMVKRARRLAPYSNVEFVVSDGVTLDRWHDGSFDVIYSFLVFQHLPRAQFDRYVAEAAAKLVPGGHLVFQIMVDDAGSHPEPPLTHPYGLRYYRRAEVEEKLRRAGLNEVNRCNFDAGPDDVAVVAGDVVFCARKPQVFDLPTSHRVQS